MNDEVASFIESSWELMLECAKFCFMSRGKEFQQVAVKHLAERKDEAIALKRRMIKIQDEDAANTMLSMEKLIDAVANELKMWVALRDDSPNEAWEFLVKAQGGVRTALQAHDVASLSNAEEYASKLHLLEKLLFPPQTFFSIGMTFGNSECSVCGKEYETCEHVVGKAYMGEICYRELKDLRIGEVSMVEEPSNKGARVFQISDGSVKRDFMTWRPIQEDVSGA